MKILIADDSSFMRNVLRDIVVGAGNEVIEAENGIEAMEKIEKEKPDLVFLDIIMPESGGIEVLKKLGKTTKIVVISAVGQDKMLQEAKSFGAKEYVVKPFENKKILDLLDKMTNESE